MALYWDGSSSWCRAAPMVRMSANTSKPSNVQPRFDAISAFHCPRFRERYQGGDPTAPAWIIIASVKFDLAPPLLQFENDEAYAGVRRAGKRALCRLPALWRRLLNVRYPAVSGCRL